MPTSCLIGIFSAAMLVISPFFRRGNRLRTTGSVRGMVPQEPWSPGPPTLVAQVPPALVESLTQQAVTHVRASGKGSGGLSSTYLPHRWEREWGKTRQGRAFRVWPEPAVP